MDCAVATQFSYVAILYWVLGALYISKEEFLIIDAWWG